MEAALADALGKAAAAGRWDVVSQLARELEARRLEGDVDDDEDIATSSRQRIVEDDPRYAALREFMKKELVAIRYDWTKLRGDAGTERALAIPALKAWFNELSKDDQRRASSLFPAATERTCAHGADRGDMAKKNKQGEYMPDAFDTIAGVEAELEEAGIRAGSQPPYTWPEVPSTDPLSTDAITLTEQYARSQGWLGFIGQMYAVVRAHIVQTENDRKYFEHNVIKTMKAETEWSHDALQDELWTNNEYLALVRKHQELVQHRVLLEACLDDLRGRRDVISRLFTVRGQEIEVRRLDGGLARRGRKS